MKISAPGSGIPANLMYSEIIGLWDSRNVGFFRVQELCDVCSQI